MAAKSYRMPSCTKADISKITDTLDRLRGSDFKRARRLEDEISSKELCRVLHAMRRWYAGAHTVHLAKRILSFREALNGPMKLDAKFAVGAYRGFKVAKDSPLAKLSPGDIVTLPVARNGGCSSWTLKRSMADRFSGASKGRVGIIVRLARASGATPFIAPPCRSESWFNRLYERTMGRSFRFKEQEYAICGRKLIVEVVCVKR